MMESTEIDMDELKKLMLLVLYANGGKMEWEKLKWATFILLKAYEEGVLEDKNETGGGNQKD